MPMPSPAADMAREATTLVRPARRALVVFEDRDEVRWLGWLRPGFRHCFCILGHGDLWTILDPLLNRIDVLLCRDAAEPDLARHLGAGGRAVLAGPIAAANRVPLRLPRPLTCVEVVKRTLNLDAPNVITPWQLHRLLQDQHGFRAYQADDGIDRLVESRLDQTQ